MFELLWDFLKCCFINLYTTMNGYLCGHQWHLQEFTPHPPPINKRVFKFLMLY